MCFVFCIRPVLLYLTVLYLFVMDLFVLDLFVMDLFVMGLFVMDFFVTDLTVGSYCTGSYLFCRVRPLQQDLVHVSGGCTGDRSSVTTLGKLQVSALALRFVIVCVLYQ